MTIGLTGGIGCGKSSVLPAFEKSGFAVIDTDKIAREIRSAPETAQFVQKRFGNAVFSENGEIIPAELAKIIFSDPEARSDLENFMHPKIRESWTRLAEKNAREGRDVAVEVPLLFEKNYVADFDATVCVAASHSVQLQHLEARGVSKEQAEERIAAQMPLSEKIRRADVVIFNDGSREFLDAQVKETIERLRTAKK